ncbi:Chaperone protein DnaJ [Smittium culicis]|uniref:Chaperone protein DnaJ n=1 Tax=Smittium culicis TaxID=133412 RepID=A0A1R1Y858_9FUNG|nr:Chaperone protein DnaJ [Smittium culicis]OMJ23221.1 Chaperone protein DnaJ [Smittium culicis]
MKFLRKFFVPLVAFFAVILLSFAQASSGDEDDQRENHHPPEGRKTLDMEIIELIGVIKRDQGTLDWYKLLNVNETAKESQINRAYRLYSRVNHPDKYTGPENGRLQSEEKFKNMGLVVSTLKDPLKRKRYDYFHHRGIPVSNRRVKLEFLGYSTRFYVFWDQVLAFPFVATLFSAIVELIYAATMYYLAQATIKARIAAAAETGVSAEYGLEKKKNDLDLFKVELSPDQIKERLDHIESLNKFNSVLTIDNPESIQAPGWDSILFVRFAKSQILTLKQRYTSK